LAICSISDGACPVNYSNTPNPTSPRVVPRCFVWRSKTAAGAAAQQFFDGTFGLFGLEAIGATLAVRANGFFVKLQKISCKEPTCVLTFSLIRSRRQGENVYYSFLPVIIICI
jgi:hypothetical protein